MITRALQAQVQNRKRRRLTGPIIGRNTLYPWVQGYVTSNGRVPEDHCVTGHWAGARGHRRRTSGRRTEAEAGKDKHEGEKRGSAQGNKRGGT
eukprot:scaffold248382_cov35-Tisochrysis_lutea.AAC.5